MPPLLRVWVTTQKDLLTFHANGDSIVLVSVAVGGKQCAGPVFFKERRQMFFKSEIYGWLYQQTE